MTYELRVDATCYWVEVIEPTTKCKHGRGDCEDCGTTSRRDVVHTTRGGRGAVSRLRTRA